MRTSAPNKIAEIRKRRKMTQAELADRLGIHWVTVSKLERGRIQLHTGWLEQISQALNVNSADILSDSTISQEVDVLGYIEDGVYSEFGENYFTIDLNVYEKGNEDYFWVVVEGSSLSPNFNDLDKLQFVPVDLDFADRNIGKFVILQGSDGSKKSGYLVKVKQNRKIDLKPVNGPIIRDIEASGLAVLTQARFAPFWDHPDGRTERGPQ